MASKRIRLEHFRERIIVFELVKLEEHIEDRGASKDLAVSRGLVLRFHPELLLQFLGQIGTVELVAEVPDEVDEELVFGFSAHVKDIVSR